MQTNISTGFFSPVVIFVLLCFIEVWHATGQRVLSG